MEVETVQVEDNDFEIGGIDDVKKRVLEAEARIKKGDFLTQEEYEEEMEKFFKRLDENN